jgi:hypothetical protein
VGIERGQFEDVVHCLVEAFGLSADALTDRLQFMLGNLAAGDQLAVPLQRVERRAQFVGGVNQQVDFGSFWGFDHNILRGCVNCVGSNSERKPA